jgi:hypothetical protein
MFQLTFIGLARQAIYILYVVAFPLSSHTQKGGPASDLEILMRDHRWFAPIHYAHWLFGIPLIGPIATRWWKTK